MTDPDPNVVVLAGPNGSGKSTMAAALLQGALAVNEFVNADTIAQGLSAFAPTAAALAAGHIMLRRIRQLARQRTNFAFESTLAGRSLAPWLADLINSGYRFHLLFLWLPSPELAVARVVHRVRMGGHDVPEETIRRRYHAGLRNFFGLYQPLAETWRMYDNSRWMTPRLVASGEGAAVTEVTDEPTWQRIRQHADEHD
jgi:predicted ABC-type ATPase